MDKTTIDIEFVYNKIQRSTWYDWGVPTWNNDGLAVPNTYTLRTNRQTVYR